MSATEIKKGGTMANEVKLTLITEKKEKGTVTGNGTISFRLNLTDLKFNVDYRDEDHLTFKLSASQGLKVSTKGSLTFSGSLEHDLLNRSWDGTVTIQMDIKKTVSATLSHRFNQKKKTIRFDLKIAL